MNYVKTSLREEIVIKKIVSVHYFEFAKDYIFEGEKHDFWELIFVDKGELEVVSDTKGYRLRRGEVLFHKPNVFHNEYADGSIAPNVVVMAFECNSSAMKFFEGKILSVDDYEKSLLAYIINEAQKAFCSPFDDSSLKKLERRSGSEFGCEQLIKIHLEQMLISFIRRDMSIKSDARLSSSIKERSDQDMAERIIKYLGENVRHNLRFDSVCQHSNLSRTHLKILFKEKTGSGVMEYFRNLKIEEAKTMLREEKYNITEIAENLSYESIHNFSRQFKKETGMSPSEYSLSIKAKAKT